MQKVYGPIAEQAKATRESYVAIQRAFVSDVRLNLIPQAIKDGKPEYWDAKITVQNSGGTPTKDLEFVSIYARWPVSMGDPEEQFGKRLDWTRIVSGRITIGPHSAAEIALPAHFGLSSANEEPNYSFPIAAFGGAIRYRDQFAGSAIHITKYCFIVWVLGTTGLIHQPCPHWNCSDDDCKTDKEAYATDQKPLPESPYNKSR
jgi:hypothetical protein